MIQKYHFWAYIQTKISLKNLISVREFLWFTEFKWLYQISMQRQIPHGISYIWNLIYGTNETFHRKEIHGHGEQTCGCQEGGEGSGMDGESGINRCKLLPLEWISNEILLYSTGNHI